MHVLVTVASKHGSTRGIAAAIADELHARGINAEARDIEEAPMVVRYDAVIIGSAVYMGNWLPEAWEFVNRNRAALAGVPVWLFSSGPLGQEDPQPTAGLNRLDELMAAAGAREHRMFVGKLDKRALGIGERLIARAVKAPEGDFRDWDAIRAWAREIASALSDASPVTRHGSRIADHV